MRQFPTKKCQFRIENVIERNQYGSVWKITLAKEDGIGGLIGSYNNKSRSSLPINQKNTFSSLCIARRHFFYLKLGCSYKTDIISLSTKLDWLKNIWTFDTTLSVNMFYRGKQVLCPTSLLQATSEADKRLHRLIAEPLSIDALTVQTLDSWLETNVLVHEGLSTVGTRHQIPWAKSYVLE